MCDRLWRGDYSLPGHTVNTVQSANTRQCPYPPPPPIRRPNLAEFAELVCRMVGFLNLADLFCRITRFLGLCRLVLPTCWGLWVLGHLSWRRHLLWDTA